jgi:hypothetical protein
MRRTIARAAAAALALAPAVALTLAAGPGAARASDAALADEIERERQAEPGAASRAWQAEPLRAQAEAESARAAAAWRSAWEELAANRAFREAGCFASAAQLAALGGDRIGHRELTRADFRARRRSRDAKLTVAMRNAVTEAHVATSLVCIGRLRAEEVTRGRFAVWFEGLEYVALLDREGSWWNPESGTHPEWVLRHEQLHFDLTELVARRRNAERELDAARTRVVAASPGEAMRRFAERWSAHFAAVLEEWEALQASYDRETRHGTVPAEQTRWFARVHRELASLPAPAR